MIDNEGKPRLLDFGQSKFLDHRANYEDSLSGSPRYMAPELTASESDVYYDEDPTVTTATDVFAFSMVALEVSNLPCVRGPTCSLCGFIWVDLATIPSYCFIVHIYSFVQILTGKLPFFYISSDSSVIVLMIDGKRPERARYLPTIFTGPMWDLIVNCWDQDPKKRPDMETVVRCLENMWLVVFAGFCLHALHCCVTVVYFWMNLAVHIQF